MSLAKEYIPLQQPGAVQCPADCRCYDPANYPEPLSTVQPGPATPLHRARGKVLLALRIVESGYFDEADVDELSRALVSAWNLLAEGSRDE